MICASNHGMRLFLLLGLWLGLAFSGTSSGGQVTPSQAPAKPPEATVSAAPEAQVFPPPPDYKFPSGQTYVYAVEWHLFSAGTATVRLDSDVGQHRVTATADSGGVVNTLYKVHDHFEAQFDPRTFCSLAINKHTEEGPHKRDTMVKFEYAQKKSLLDEKNLKTGEQKHEQNDIPGCVTDVITGFYYLASLPLQPGNRSTFPISGGGKTTVAESKVETREQIKVPAGTFQTVRVHVEAISGPLRGKGSVLVWYTDDANHTPVQMRSKLGWGTLLFRLQRIDRR
jgi:hypothetical protein